MNEMRTDHYAYQRATRIASFGLLVQIIIGLTLLTFGIVGEDTAFRFAALYVLSGVLVWVGLIIIFHQHKLERLEALEEDELAAARGGSTSMFDSAAAETRVAARRLAMMHKWLMPGLSLALAMSLGGLAAWMIRHLSGLDPRATDFALTDEEGWAVSIALGFAVAAFIFSRFIAGMAKQPAWQNLRGGASYMVGNALVLAAVAIGIIFRFFENNSVILAIAWAIPVLMSLQVLEILLNFILNLYRPRIPGEVPRPAFDSRVLSWFASPDSIVRSLNEAVNYQFGFDVTSSWGYQLLLRSFVWLAGLGIVALVLLNMMVVVEPSQQALRLRGGRIVDGRVHDSGIMWKYPWPFETAAVYDVTSIRTLALTARQNRQRDVYLWTDEMRETSTAEIEPFLVGASTAQSAVRRAEAEGEVTPAAFDEKTATATAPAEAISESEASVTTSYSLVDAEIVLQYRIRSENNGLIDYLSFAPDTPIRGKDLTEREQTLRTLALSQISEHLSRMPLEDVISPGRTNLLSDLRDRIQRALDDPQVRAGIEIIAVTMPMIRPADTKAKHFEELAISVQARLQNIAQAQSNLLTQLAFSLGDANLADKALAGIDAWKAAEAQFGADSPQATELRLNVERLLAQGGGAAAQTIEAAETDRWVALMNARSRASELVGQLPAYRASPELYKQLRMMEVFTNTLPGLKKYIIGIDPARVNVQLDLKEINPLLDFSGAINKETTP